MAHQFHNEGRPKKAEPVNSRSDFGELEAMIRELADIPTSGETPGIAKDYLLDEIIGACRVWRDREDRSNSWGKNL